MLDPVEFGKAMAVIVREHTAPLLDRIKALEARHPEKGERGEQGPPGVGERGEKGDAGERGGPGDKGEPGQAGQDAEPIDVKEVVAELLAGSEVKTLVDFHVAEAVQKHFEANPIQHGKDGRDGKDGDRGEKGDAGTKGDPGADGVGLAGAMIDRDGCLIVTTTKGAPINLGTVVGKDGDKGKDGADLSTASIMEWDGHRTLSIKSKDGAIVSSHKLPIPLDRGYYRDGMECEKGDIVTHAGNAWIALVDTKSKPCLESKDDWRLFARKGRDGIDGAAGRNLGPAPPVKWGNGNA